MRVALYRNYREDQQQSIRIYADMLARHLPPAGVDVVEVTPHELVPEAVRRLRSVAKVGDFAGRYLLHPVRARGHRADVHHIIDHGTAHLLLALDKERTVVTCHDLVPLLTHRGLLPRGHVPAGARAIFRAVTTLLPQARLILADKAKICDYLMAYLTNREYGKTLKEAHHNAMEYIGITQVAH